MQDDLRALIQGVLDPQPVELQDIPDINLYMDQVLTFMDTRLTKLKRSHKEKVYTKTMINNYVKAGLILSPEKKKYSRENMILLLLIYRLKHILSIQDIAALFSIFGREQQVDKRDGIIQEAYKVFLETQKYGQEDFGEMCCRKAEMIQELVPGSPGEEKTELEWLSLVLSLINQADLQRRLAEQIIDTHFKK